MTTDPRRSVIARREQRLARREGGAMNSSAGAGPRFVATGVASLLTAILGVWQ
ncbi:hypothetical protein [Oerskovia enterophila]|uniref:hypothetical protein n=1 Tax=Oerskovia enterophila TaxID=43678 RepID=UPI00382947A6